MPDNSLTEWRNFANSKRNILRHAVKKACTSPIALEKEIDAEIERVQVLLAHKQDVPQPNLFSNEQ